MAQKDFIQIILDHIEDNALKIEFNNKMFEIMEGDLMKYIEIALLEQLNANSAKIALLRACPINVWNKIVRKLSTLYTKPVTRTTELKSDQELISYYVNRGLDKHFGNMNENFNAYKWSSLEIFEDTSIKSIRFRSIPSNQFIAYSNDEIDPLRPTAIIKFMGTYKDVKGVERNRYWIYTANEFISILDNGDYVKSDMEINSGINPFNVIPIEYVAQSEYMLIPMPDKDTLQMTKLIPVLITDQNYGSMYLSFPILYTLDADAENLPANPNVFWNLKSDSEDKSSSVGVVKAEPNLEAQMNHTIRQLATWMDSRDIRPGTIGKVSADNFSSGISKIISEMDTLENRKLQEMKFKEVENRFWRRLAIIHNKLASVGRIENRQKFSDPANLNVAIEYTEERIIESREDKVRRLSSEVKAGFNSIRRSIRELNPNMDESQIEKLLDDISQERTTIIETNNPGVQD